MLLPAGGRGGRGLIPRMAGRDSTAGVDPVLTAYVAAATVATVAGAIGCRPLAAITKPLPIGVLAMMSLGRAPRSRVDTALLAGALAFSAAGDRAMLLEEFTPAERDRPPRPSLPTALGPADRYLRRGAALFGGAQLCYAGLLWRRGARPVARRLLPRVAALTESASVVAMHRPGLLPVLVPYGNTLALMSALAADDPRSAQRLRLGGLLFLASDLSILNRRHLMTGTRVRAVVEYWVLGSYFAAQWLLVANLARPTETEGRR